ncbi:T9SS type A sorting domain-containing protein [Flavilitoribacter nigricans]|nr:T9SS type A sorting domain-containing protein [Flavilitoribacter nigricans]
MENNYIKIILMACCVLFASHLNAQFRFGDKPSIGQTLNVDPVTGVATFLLDFNTDKPSSSWSADPEISISFQKCQTNRGFQSKVYESDDPAASTIFNDDFKVRRWNSNENAVHMASIDSMEAIFDKWAEKYAGTEDSVKNTIWKPSACLFDVNGDPDNQAFGTHPGQYKKVEYGYQFSFSGTAVISDIEFELDTYDAGNTGQTASYDLIVAIGSESNIVSTIEDIYVTGSGQKTVKVAEAIGMDYAEFSNQKVYFWVSTEGTGTPIARDSFDPTIVFDNMTVAYQLPVWVNPPAGAVGNSILDNLDDPLVAPEGVATLTSIHLQTTSRLGELVITNDLQDPSVKLLDFLESGALKANDGSGNYTVDVPYTIEPAIYDEFAGQWTKARITVGAPAEGTIDDDMMLYFNATPRSAALEFARIELDAGTRIWFDYYMKGDVPLGSLLYVGALGPDSPIPSDSVTIDQLEAAGYTVTLIDDNDVSDGGYDYSPYDAVVFGESTSSSRVVAFGKTDNYPIPAVILEPLAVRDDKWGWITDRADFTENRDCLEGTNSFTILDTTHYITSIYNQGQVIDWTTAICGMPETIAAFGFDLDPYVDGAMALAKNNSTAVTTPNLWAIPAGTAVEGGTKTTDHKIVLLGIHEFGIYGKDDDMTEYATEDFYTLLTRSVEWVLMSDPVASKGNLLYVGALGPDNPILSDSVSIAQIEAAGYTVTLVDDNDVTDGGYDYSPYDAVVFGESTSSSRVVAFGTIDNYPIPAVILEPLAVRDDKWGWITDRADFTENRDCLEGTNSFTILDNTHYITSEFEQDQVIDWTTAICGMPETIAAFGFDLGKYVDGAIPLAKNNSTAVTTPNLWAVPTGSSVEGGTKTTEHKIVLLGIHEFGIYGKDEDMTEYATDDFYTLLTRSIDWVLQEDVVEPVANLLYVGAQGPANVVPSDSVSIDQLEQAGYAVTLIDDNEVAAGGYDYSGYDAVVFGESCSSSNVVAFGNTDKFPIPCLMFEPLSVRTDKWGWVVNPDPGTYGNSDYPGFKEDRDCQEGTTSLQILNSSHYITSDYMQDEVIPWSTATCGTPETIFAFGFNINQDMSGGIPLAKNNSLGIADANLWAMPAGTTVTGDTVTTEHRLVVFGIHELGIYGKDDDMTEYATPEFYNLMLRSVEWILGNGDDGVVGTAEKPEITRNILAYPNPTKEQVRLRFDLETAGTANLYLSNMMGQRIEIFRNQQFFTGTNEVEVDLSRLTPGVYVYQLEAEGKAFVGKLMIAE